MRDLKELLPIVIHSLEVNRYSETGICKEIGELFYRKKITNRERNVLEKFICKNKPTRIMHSEFYRNNNNMFYWETLLSNPQTRQIRIDFLTKLLNELP